MIQLTVSADAAGQRLDKLVRKALRDVPLSHVYKMFRTRKVRVNGARGKADQVVAEGDVVVIRGDEERLLAKAAPAAPGGAPRVTFGVLHEDADLLAVDKPAGLAAHPGTGIEGATLVEMARGYLKTPDDLPPTEFKPSPAHRLDRDTSGVVLVAKHRKAMVRLGETFTTGEGVHKTYLALVKGKMPREAGTIDLPLSEHEQTSKSKAMRGVNFQEALTRWKVVSAAKEISLLAVTIETGRTHQIRRHLEAVGHPVAGDRRYGDFAFNRTARTRWGLRRMGLHAWRLEVPHPLTGAPLRLEAPFPAELAEVLSRANLKLPASPTGAHAPGARREGPHRER
ncbi:RluA family pseudouridine synthase [Anaeromyxobacter dehalogenans]|uniref:Pseudouridine synthase n=1 Tax=Anaeromyxobacter dehalogenans (strain 2CP-C) TaxID=290397 RepID=Q2IM03_ANADE|nr:RluA family pseudouridine synthase [Anaeromyxobacter dehalogenans]ABC79834.1 ribosomal large subunit pseudouridine synthase C [Anaeromyxobacter dehalogenans 2CP-C]